MILEYGFRNFFSFKESASISFKVDAHCPPEISQGNDYVTVMGVKGANGSGKTQVLKALAFLNYFCVHSFDSKPDELIGVDTFYKSSEPTCFYVEFRLGETTYRYELKTTVDSVVSEVIYRTKKKTSKVLERQGNELVYRIQPWKKLDAMKLRKNVSIIAMAHQYELDELKDFYNFFFRMASNVDYGGLKYYSGELSAVAEYLNGKDEILEFIKKFIQECDVGISDIRISHYINKEGKKEYFPIFIHTTAQGEEIVTDVTESSGTKTLFRDLTNYWLMLRVGGILVVDELDMNLHPHILPKLINLFIDPASNSTGAQLIFSTHDSEILNLLGRYRTYLVSKEDNESYAYRLDEIPGEILRNDRPIRPVYNSGKIGGVPRI